MNAKILLGALLSLTLAGCVVPVDANGNYRPNYDDNQTQSESHHSHHHRQNVDVAAGSRVSALDDLVGARAGQAQGELEGRGYQFVRDEDAGNAVYGYYRERNTGNCVTTRTEDGRYQSIAYASKLDCR